MIPVHPVRSLCTVLLTAALLAGCGSDDATGPLRSVEGDYRPTYWTVTTSEGILTDVIAAGGQLPLRLDGSGGVTGRLVIPAGVVDVSAADIEFDGRYEVRDGVVHIQSDEDIFLRDMPLTVLDATLAGDSMFGGTRVQVTFTRQTTQ